MRFSVIIPAYNAEKTINRAVSSVLTQTFEDFELIIVDDGSNDNTEAYINIFQDKRIKYYRQKNNGVSFARNKGIEESIAEYICFLDADDEWKKDHLEVLSEMIENYKDCGIYVTGHEIRLLNGKTKNRFTEITKNINEGIHQDGYEILNKYGYFIHTNSVCCKREVFDKVGKFALGIKNGEDDDMWFRIFAYYPLAISKKITTIYDRENSSATNIRPTNIESKFYTRLNTLLLSSKVPQNRKNSLMIWAERNKLSRARKHIILGNKKEAIKLIKTVSLKKVNKKKYFETLISLFIPSPVISKILKKRDKAYYE